MIKAAIIGTGIGLKHFEAIHGYRSSKVIVIYEKDKRRNKILKKKFPNIKITNNEDDVFKNESVNLVSIASYDQYHYTQIKKCFKYNKHIIVEKPICLSAKELLNIKKMIYKNKKIKFVSNLVLRVNSLFTKIKSLISSKNIFYIEGDYIWGRKYKLYGWRSKTKNYSLTLGAGIHLIDLIIWLIGKKPTTVSTFGNNIATNKTVFKRNSLMVYIFKFPGNIIAKVTANAAGYYNHFHELRVFCKNKTIINTPGEKVIYSKKNKKKLIIKKLNGSYPDKINRKKLIRNFIDQIYNKKIKPIISVKEQLDLMTVCFEADKSLKKGKKIKIKYL